MRNGLTPEIEDLIMTGTMITTTCHFRCDTISRTWHRFLQYNPIKGNACFKSNNGMCDSVFAIDELDEHFNILAFCIGTIDETRVMRKQKATLKIAVTTKIDAYSLGKKDLWPETVSLDFVVPRVP
ncbi:MAG: hypothetical protein GY845_11355, partial [Planctomycetes bacterium]|nr:hypothetical protein [Planctomycetota bacterium]